MGKIPLLTADISNRALRLSPGYSTVVTCVVCVRIKNVARGLGFPEVPLDLLEKKKIPKSKNFFDNFFPHFFYEK